jgi:hypothetical protein
MSTVTSPQTGSIVMRPPGYPVEWEADVVLRDGSVAHVRPITPADGPAVRRFHAGQSEESIYLRFFAPLRELSDKDIHRFTVVDYDDRVALVVTLRDDIVGIGRYDQRRRAARAEVAFNISPTTTTARASGRSSSSTSPRSRRDGGRHPQFAAEVLAAETAR